MEALHPGSSSPSVFSGSVPNQTSSGATKHDMNPNGLGLGPVVKSVKKRCLHPGAFLFPYHLDRYSPQAVCICHGRQFHERLPSTWDFRAEGLLLASDLHRVGWPLLPKREARDRLSTTLAVWLHLCQQIGSKTGAPLSDLPEAPSLMRSYLSAGGPALGGGCCSSGSKGHMLKILLAETDTRRALGSEDTVL